MATLGLIGSGFIGGTVARLAVGAGLDVVLSNSRGPQSLAGLVDELGPQARGQRETLARVGAFCARLAQSARMRAISGSCACGPIAS
ncbi:NAD(P)-binding domain-containing protein [Saccharopolyspora sp. K220]|nr:NAD(P)-binding domain-containing protein [Saccharopolyspora soli]